MKKVIFISALAIAAAVSCTKSDIVDTKFNEAISFENYIGRDAMTKATVADADALKAASYEGIGLYGFYTGAKPWKFGEHAQNANALTNPTANLWDGDALKYSEGKWSTTDTKYWTNGSDYYSFLAYAPLATANNGVSVNGTLAEDVNVTYAIPVTPVTNGEVTKNKLTTNIDLLYAQVVNTTKTLCGGNVSLNFKHALSRVTVKAYAPTNTMGIQFDVKNVTLSGTFNTVGTLNLATAKAAAGDVTTDAGWSVNDSDKKTAYYVFCDEPAAATIGEDGKAIDALTTTAVDYSGTTVEGTTTTYGNNYLMMIPTNFDGVLSVTYTTIYEGQESNPMTKTLDLETNFMMGKAYAITLAFEPVLDVITFNVTVDTWGEEIPVLEDEGTSKNDNPENKPWA